MMKHFGNNSFHERKRGVDQGFIEWGRGGGGGGGNMSVKSLTARARPRAQEALGL